MLNIWCHHWSVLFVGAIAMIFAYVDPMAAVAQNKFDGKWTVNNSSETCMVKMDTWTLIVRNGAVSASGKYPPTGSISESGESHWTRSAKKDGLPVTYSGNFRGNVGTGTYVSSARVPCAGRFSAKRQ
jgi:hypothetical protein